MKQQNEPQTPKSLSFPEKVISALQSPVGLAVLVGCSVFGVVIFLAGVNAAARVDALCGAFPSLELWFLIDTGGELASALRGWLETAQSVLSFRPDAMADTEGLSGLVGKAALLGVASVAGALDVAFAPLRGLIEIAVTVLANIEAVVEEAQKAITALGENCGA